MNNIYLDKYQEKYALIIGIGTYKNLGPLNNAENDATELKNILIKKYGYKKENIKLLLGKDATRDNINDTLYEYVNIAMNDDSLLFFYAGHGTTILDNSNNNVGYLVPYDGNEKNYNSLIRWDSIENAAKMIKAKHIFFILDACYSGLAFNRSCNIGSQRFVSDILTRYSRQVLTAGKGDQTVSDAKGPLSNHSVFSGYLLQYLNDDNRIKNEIINANNVMSYVYNNVAKNTNTQQTPQWGWIAGDGDFIFNHPSLLKDEVKDEKKDGENNEELIKINYPNDIDIYRHLTNTTEKIKELIPDKKNKIKITELVNQELRIAVNMINNISNYDNYSDENFLKNIEIYEDSVKSLIPITIYLAQYGDNEYISLLKKIIIKLIPKKNISGSSCMIDLMSYPAFIIYYCIIITAIDNENLELLKEILLLEYSNMRNSYIKSDYVLIKLANDLVNISKLFNLLDSDKEHPYKFPINEHLYIMLQSEFEDILFLGEDYEKRFCECEFIIFLLSAIETYDKNSPNVWGPLGRFHYKYNYSLKENISNLDAYKIALKIGLLNCIEIEQREDFNTKTSKYINQSIF